jgi:type I restriction enzyme, S subunit
MDNEKQMSNQNQHRLRYKHTALGWIPNEWQMVTIQDLVQENIIEKPLDGNHGNIHPTSSDFVKTGIPFIMANNVQNGILDLANCKFIKKEQADKLQKGFSRSGDVLLTHKGTVGNVAIVNGIPTEYIMLTPQVTYYRIKDGKRLDRNYLKQFFEGERFQHTLQILSGGGTRSYIGITDQRQLPFLLLPIKEQFRIAAILSAWDEAITKTQQLIAQLQQRNKGLMQQLLTGKRRLRGFEGQEWGKLHATDIFKSVSVKNNGSETLLSATQDRGIIPREMLEARVTMPAGETGSFKLVEIGDFVISLRSFQGGIEYSEYRGLVSPAYTVLKPTKRINTSFFKHYFKSYDFIGHLAVAVIGIRDGKQVSYEDFSILKLPYPDVKEQEAIAKVLDAAIREVKLYEQKLAGLQQQKKGLMQKLLTGEVRVTV